MIVYFCNYTYMKPLEQNHDGTPAALREDQSLAHRMHDQILSALVSAPKL